MEVIKAIADRWSPRAFENKHIPDEDIETLFEAARWAASAYNEQPWRFIYAKQKDGVEYTRLLECLVPGNQAWAKFAPVLVVAIAKNNLTRNDRHNPHALYDLGLAVGNLSVQATAMGISLHQMGGFSADAAVEKLNIPEGHSPVAMIAMGYAGEPSYLPEELQAREKAPRTRKELDEIVFSNTWKEGA